MNNILIKLFLEMSNQKLKEMYVHIIVNVFPGQKQK